MRLKIHILLLLALTSFSLNTEAKDKFLRIKGELINENTKEPIEGFTIKKVLDEYDSSFVNFDKSEFDLWLPANHTIKLFFIKEGYVINFMLIDATFIPAIAFKKKQKIEDLKVKMNKVRGTRLKMDKPVLVAEYVPRENQFEVKDMTLKKNQKLPEDYEPPFPSPADTYINAKPTNKNLKPTADFDAKKAEGNSGISRVLQGILFADMNYYLFNERTNDANKILAHLKAADGETWGNIEVFDSPEYGRIVTRTLNREQSVDTLFALGAYLETSRLVFQNFTSDSKVLVHLKTLNTVLNQFEPSAPSPAVQEFMKGMYALMPHIQKLEKQYKQKLRDRLNFEMEDNEAFKAILAKLEALHQEVIR